MQNMEHMLYVLNDVNYVLDFRLNGALYFGNRMVDTAAKDGGIEAAKLYSCIPSLSESSSRSDLEPEEEINTTVESNLAGAVVVKQRLVLAWWDHHNASLTVATLARLQWIPQRRAGLFMLRAVAQSGESTWRRVVCYFQHFRTSVFSQARPFRRSEQPKHNWMTQKLVGGDSNRTQRNGFLNQDAGVRLLPCLLGHCLPRLAQAGRYQLPPIKSRSAAGQLLLCAVPAGTAAWGCRTRRLRRPSPSLHCKQRGLCCRALPLPGLIKMTNSVLCYGLVTCCAVLPW